MKTVVIMAGGTGGHVFPALAVAQEFAKRGYQIQWLGGEHGIEQRLVPQAGYPLKALSVKGLRGGGMVKKLLAPLMILGAVNNARRWLKGINPVLVVGFGGYASGPGGIAARLARVPLAIHEQNAVPGLTNKVLHRVAKRTLVAFDGVFNAAVDVVGNPVREDIVALPAPEERYANREGALRLQVLGGSQGALALNSKLPAALAAIAKDVPLDIRHQAGRNNAETTTAAYESAGLTAQVDEFIDDMASAYGWADLVICRAGALTISELAAAGVPALCIPLPTAADDHQTKNAQWLANYNAARVLPQAQLTTAGLQQQLMDILYRDVLANMAENARAASTPDSARRVASLCEELIK